MVKYDRYMLSQLLWLFGFFALVLVAVFWINRAVQLFDRLIGDGQTALVFLEFSALGMPRLIVTVLPIAAFAATIYVTNRMNNESELTVMMSTGTSPWRLARPVALFGLIAALMVSALTHLLEPNARGQLQLREAEVSANISARLLTDGTFLSPTTGVTLYTRAISEDGVLKDVFLSDRRNTAEEVIYIASEAYLVRQGEQTSLIMVDGLAQRLDQISTRLSVANFADFSFDISALVNTDVTVAPALTEMSTPVLVRDWRALAAAGGFSPGAMAEELHSRIARATFCFITGLVGFAMLLVGGYSRFGVWREIVIAFLILIVLDGMPGTLTSYVLADARLWPLLYLPTAIGALLIMVLLWWSAHPGALRGWRRAAA